MKFFLNITLLPMLMLVFWCFVTKYISPNPNLAAFCQHFQLIVSEGQESRSGSAEWFLLRFFHEVVIKLLARVAVISRRPNWEKEFAFKFTHQQLASLTSFWLLARDSTSLLDGLPHRAAYSMAVCPTK